MILLYFALRALVQTLCIALLILSVFLLVGGYIHKDWQAFPMAIISAQIAKSGFTAMEDDD